MSGKGDSPRPLSVDRETHDANWLRTFGERKPATKPKQEEKPSDK